MKIVGQVSSPEEAKELENIAKLFVINGRIKKLAFQSKGENILIEDKQIKNTIVFITADDL